MLSALLATALAVVPVEAPNAVSLSARGRTVTLSAAQLAVSCASCSLTRAVAQTPPPPPPPTDDQFTPPPLIDSDPNPNNGGELSPPPDVPPWQAPPEDAPRAEPPKTDLKTDPHLGMWVPKEVAMGALAVVGSDLLAGGVIGAVTLVSLAAAFGRNSGDAIVGLFIAGALGLVHIVLSPLWAALAVKAVADEPTANGLGGAALGAYLSAFALGGVGLGVMFALALIQSALPVSSGGYSAVSSLGTLIVLVGICARWVGVPLAASWAMHRGTASATPPPPPPREHPRRQAVITADGREARPLGGATVMVF